MSRTHKNVQAPGGWVKVVAGSFQTNGSSDPTAVSGTGFTVARSATGVFTITLEQKYPQMLATVAGTQAAAAVAGAPRVEARATDMNDGTIELVTMSGTTDWDFESSLGLRVDFISVLRNSSITE